MSRALALVALLALSGCQYGTIDITHLSHPAIGIPVTSSHDANGAAREGTINQIGATLGRCYGRVCVEQSLGWDTSYNEYSSLKGGRFLYTGRVSYRVLGGVR